ncbi:MAG: methylamine utilization protein [Gemmatimonadetes bacterium]|nr:methylamine utilization protein [Gemmatimonadota bacterium]
MSVWATGDLAAQLPSGGARHSHGIWLEDKQFSQPEIAIAVSDTIVFANDDRVMHNIFSSTDGARFNLLRQASGSKKAAVFATTGTVLVRCAFHPSMRLTVIVQ